MALITLSDGQKVDPAHIHLATLYLYEDKDKNVLAIGLKDGLPINVRGAGAEADAKQLEDVLDFDKTLHFGVFWATKKK